MNEVIYEGSDHSPINIPPFDGYGSYQLHYHHTIDNTEKNIVTAVITVTIMINEKGGTNRTFKIMNATSKFRILIKDKVLIPPDLIEVWNKSAEHVIHVYNSFQRKKFGYTHPIELSGAAWLIAQVLPVVAWCNENNGKK